jgi:hypothetical protein
MAILAGVDLLAKFYAGTDRGSVADRFRRFSGDYFHLSGLEAEQLYQLRNAMMHSFGLYSRVEKHGTIIAQYWFVVGADRSGTGKLVEPHPGDHYFVGIRTLHDAFEAAVGEYHHDLQRSDKDGDDLMKHFMKVWDHYGYISQGRWPG